MSYMGLCVSVWVCLTVVCLTYCLSVNRVRVLLLGGSTIYSISHSWLYVCLSLRPSICSSICLSIYLYRPTLSGWYYLVGSTMLAITALTVCLSVYLCVCVCLNLVRVVLFGWVHYMLATHPWLSVCLSICLSVYIPCRGDTPWLGPLYARYHILGGQDCCVYHIVLSCYHRRSVVKNTYLDKKTTNVQIVTVEGTNRPMDAMTKRYMSWRMIGRQTYKQTFR